MHEQESQYNQNMNTKSNIFETVILGFLAVLASGQFINFIVTMNLESQQIFYVTMNVLQLILIFLEYVVKGYREINKFEKNAVDHTYISVKIRSNWTSNNFLCQKERDSANEFLRNIIKNFNDMLFLAPPIREATKNKYLEESHDNDMFNPLIVDGENLQIVINDEKMENLTGSNEPDSQMKYQIDRWLQHF